MSTGVYQHRPHSQETKLKISAAHLGKKMSEDAKKSMRNSESIWSSYNERRCTCGNKLCRGNSSGICWLCSRQKTLGGKNHYNWQGGITSENKRLRNSLQMKEWRQKVFERDNYTCQECHKRGVHLHADHIKPFSKFPELRFELSNGRTLCIPCHEKTPTYKGRIHRYVA